ncbi:hypothetical protein C7H09_00045 [Marinobacter fuscus]|uniref:Uncharacterized protein n=1 Tax=Marinobacter fuscus TaxID=2109942 RepID=A0A2T1KGX3_9GAMM|nr:hypothetical protein C7H09_10800 [Marinobacter fuscus]PSF07705.1 hypothetical protein C7H09_09380 [Marinobacter fuscus]PSF09003.1 hypothetical protein C7H09_08170 [Marinobacter fuscus]PSF09250.1 hypothetical protein C7H09_07990 [Marinobacter fuscus]PSF09255.1 hypothetical protein C7H09_07940 [Marinobacter fuscus]
MICTNKQYFSGLGFGSKNQTRMIVVECVFSYPRGMSQADNARVDPLGTYPEGELFLSDRVTFWLVASLVARARRKRLDYEV